MLESCPMLIPEPILAFVPKFLCLNHLACMFGIWFSTKNAHCITAIICQLYPINHNHPSFNIVSDKFLTYDHIIGVLCAVMPHMILWDPSLWNLMSPMCLWHHVHMPNTCPFYHSCVLTASSLCVAYTVQFSLYLWSYHSKSTQSLLSLKNVFIKKQWYFSRK